MASPRYRRVGWPSLSRAGAAGPHPSARDDARRSPVSPTKRISFRKSGCPTAARVLYLGERRLRGHDARQVRRECWGRDFNGTRLNRVFSPNVPSPRFRLLRPLSRVRSIGGSDEGFGNWVERAGSSPCGE